MVDAVVCKVGLRGQSYDRDVSLDVLFIKMYAVHVMLFDDRFVWQHAHPRRVRCSRGLALEGRFSSG